MKVLFIADTTSNAGPANVNAEISRKLSSDTVLTNIQRISLDNLGKVLLLIKQSDYIFVDGFDRLLALVQKVALILKKPYVVLMHGYLTYENKINDLGFASAFCLAYEKYLMRSTAIITLSVLQKDFLIREKSELSGKVFTCPMGIHKEYRVHKTCHGTIRIAVSGGTRPIKRNDFVARAVNLVSAGGRNIEFVVYGRDYSGKKDFIEKGINNGSLVYRGQVTQDRFIEELRTIDVFVMASLHESFGLSAIDALQSGASLLLSDQCGVAEVLSLQDCDRITIKNSEQEVARKIERLIKYPNAERLAKTVNYKRYNWEVFATEFVNVLKSL